jgi:Putative zinc-finger
MTDPTRREELLAAEADRAARGCPSADDLAAYQDGTLAPADRSRVEAHLPACASCRAALEFLTSDSSAEPAKGRDLPEGVQRKLDETMAAVQGPGVASRVPVWMKVAAGIFLAVSLASVGHRWLAPEGFDENLGELRSEGHLEVIEPVGSVASVPDRFSWSPHPLATGYALILFDGKMNEIWSGHTEDDATEFSLDEDARSLLAPGGKFSWQVVALDQNEFGFDRSPVGHFEIATPSR